MQCRFKVDGRFSVFRRYVRLLDEQGGQSMRKEDLKNWTRDMLKDRIIELGGIIEQWKRDNEKMLQITERTKKGK